VGGGVERRYTIQRTIRWLKNRCQVGPTILFECPARSPAPPFDHFPFGPAILRRRVPSERALGAAEFFPVTSRQVRG